MMKRSTATISSSTNNNNNNDSLQSEDRPSSLQRPARRLTRKKKGDRLLLLSGSSLGTRGMMALALILLVGFLLYRSQHSTLKKHENLILQKKKSPSSEDVSLLLRNRNNVHSQHKHNQEQQQREEHIHPHDSPANDLHKQQQPQHDSHSHTRFLMELGGLLPANNRTDPSTTGRVILETRADWAPMGVDHFHELVEHQYYHECRFFRTVPRFVVQFGIAADPQNPLKKKLFKTPLQDDPVLHSNEYGTMTYATSGKNTRNFQLFINTNPHGNAYLDKEGFAPFARIIEGMEYVERINHRHKQEPKQGQIQRRGNEYLLSEFPDLSYIIRIEKMD